jgi:hypothetical protein
VLTAGELFAVTAEIEALVAAGTIDSSWRELVDFRQVTRAEMVPAEAVQQLAKGSPWPRTARRVILAPVTVVYGVSRMYQLLTDAAEGALAVVRTEAEALRLLLARPGDPDGSPPRPL